MLTKAHVAFAVIPICIAAAVYGAVRNSRANDWSSELYDVDEELFNELGGAQVDSTLYATLKKGRDAIRAEAGQVEEREESLLLARIVSAESRRLFESDASADESKAEALKLWNRRQSISAEVIDAYGEEYPESPGEIPLLIGLFGTVLAITTAVLLLEEQDQTERRRFRIEGRNATDDAGEPPNPAVEDWLDYLADSDYGPAPKYPVTEDGSPESARVAANRILFGLAQRMDGARENAVHTERLASYRGTLLDCFDHEVVTRLVEALRSDKESRDWDLFRPALVRMLELESLQQVHGKERDQVEGWLTSMNESLWGEFSWRQRWRVLTRRIVPILDVRTTEDTFEQGIVRIESSTTTTTYDLTRPFDLGAVVTLPKLLRSRTGVCAAVVAPLLPAGVFVALAIAEGFAIWGILGCLVVLVLTWAAMAIIGGASVLLNDEALKRCGRWGESLWSGDGRVEMIEPRLYNHWVAALGESFTTANAIESHLRKHFVSPVELVRFRTAFLEEALEELR